MAALMVGRGASNGCVDGWTWDKYGCWWLDMRQVRLLVVGHEGSTAVGGWT